MSSKLIFSEYEITFIDCSELELQKIYVHLINQSEPIEITGFDALDLVYRLKPSYLEGKRFKWKKNAWALHNLVGHPLTQIFAWCGWYELAMKVHDGTVPKPIGFNK